MNPSNVSESQTSQGTAGGTVQNAKQSISATARDAATQLKSAASTTTQRAREEAQRIAAEKKTTAADRLGSYSSAIHESAKSLEEQDPNIAWFTHRAADRLQGVADYVRERDFDDLRHDAEDVARRHPALFFGGLFVAGILLGTVLKASGRRLREDSEFASDEGAPDWAATGSSSSSLPETSMSSGI